MNPAFPIYIPSKGRWESRLTAKALDAIGVPYRIVVERQELAAYSAVIDPARLLVLDPSYQEAYDAFDDLGMSKSKGSGPSRNFIWDHAIAEGHPWHWIMDDNIRAFYRLNHNLKVPVGNGTFFRCMEDFCLRYQNIAMAGPNYFMFASRKAKAKPFTLNTRIYSCNLIRNDVPYRWRGRYNEDTDLSVRMLKDKWCTVLFNAFLQEKMVTQSLKGGNTDEIYADGTLPKSQMIVRMHPDVARVAWRFRRWHHHVNYKPFQSTGLVRRPDVKVKPGPNEYGMKLHTVATKKGPPSGGPLSPRART